MGGALAVFGIGGEVNIEAGDGGEGTRDAAMEKAAQQSGRKNSLALAIGKFIKYNPDEVDLDDLLNEIREEKDKQNPARKKNLREDKWAKAAKAVLMGSYKELRTQVVLHFSSINRKYKDNWVGYSLIHFVCQEGYDRMLEFMLDPKSHSEFDENEIEIDIKNDRGRTALQLVFTAPTGTWLGLRNGLNDKLTPVAERPDGIEIASDWIKPGGPKARQRCIELLAKNGANVNICDVHDYTPMHYCAMWGWDEGAEVLLDHKADVNAVNMAGKVPLHVAVEYNHPHFIELLLEDPRLMLEATDSEGYTALIMAAVVAGEDDDTGYDMVEILLKGGADPDAATHRRKSPLGIACKNQNLTLVHLLLNHNCQRRNSAIAMLNEDNEKQIRRRLEAEDMKAAAEAEAAEKAKEKAILEGTYDEGSVGIRNKNPWGAWVEYNDKRGKGIFYYNPVTRASQWEKPKDFKKDYMREVKDATFGMHFYH
jgi:hypothetical protein